MGIERRAAHERTELRRADHGARGELDDRSQRHEVGPGADRHVGQPARGGGTDRRGIQRRRRPIGEGVRGEDRAVGVGEDPGGRERERAEDGQGPRTAAARGPRIKRAGSSVSAVTTLRVWGAGWSWLE